MNRKLSVLVSLFVVFSLYLSACASQATPAIESSSGAAGSANEIEPTAAETTAPEELAAATVAMVTSGSLGDNGIFDLAAAGLDRAREELGIEYKILEGKQDPSLYFNLLQTAAQNYKLVFVNPGYQFSEHLKQIAPKYPDTFFVYMDGVSDVEGDNIVSMATKDNEGSYLAGILAAGMSTLTDIEGINEDKVLGLVGAIDAPVINNFAAGFKDGVTSIDPEFEVTVLYAGAFDNPAKGKELATSLYDQSADVVYNVAALTGQGVLQAAKETGHYAIGVDVDQCALQPGAVLASMMKRFDNTTFLLTESFVNGELRGGDVFSYGLKEGGVELRMCSETSSLVPADLTQKIEEANQQISSGEITVDSVK